jgi:ribosomal protein L16 Arg81 hydroxylase
MQIKIGLAQLLGTNHPHEFFEQFWECSPRVVVGAIEATKDCIMTLDDFEALLTTSSMGTKAEVSIVECGVARPLNRTGPERQLMIEDAYRRGCTLLQTGLQLRWTPLARVCREIENEFFRRDAPLAEAVSANSYLTPAHARGFDLHYDNHCAIVLQLHGSKDWTVFAPSEELPVKRCMRPLLRRELQDPLILKKLSAGDVLYIPRGFPHSAATNDEQSLHVTLAIRPITWAEAIRSFCDAEPAFRRSVARPFKQSVQEDGQMYFERTLLQKLSRMQVKPTVERLLAEGLTQLKPLATERESTVQGNEDIHANLPLVRIAYAVCSCTEPREARLHFPGGVLRLPIEMKSVFQFIANHTEFTPAMLPKAEAQYDPLELSRILLKMGLVEPKTESSKQFHEPGPEAGEVNPRTAASSLQQNESRV